MIKHGVGPYLECSSAGDKRFSAFYAVVNGKTIEEQYQAAKVFEDGSTGLSIKQAKGRNPVNRADTTKMYYDMWRQYINENPELGDILIQQSGLSDKFGQKGHVCQASVLWSIRLSLIHDINFRKFFDDFDYSGQY